MKEKIHIEEYVPLKKTVPRSTLPVISAWKGLELIIEDILDRFNIERESCIEFGVEFGFSSVVFSNYFKTHLLVIYTLHTKRTITKKLKIL